MRVFVTGATGFIGSALLPELINAGHQVVGLARSALAAKTIETAGAEAFQGDLENLDSLRRGADAADGVVHAGFIHDFTRFQEVCAVDRVAIETIGGVLEGSDRPFIVTSGIALVSPGQRATEAMWPSSVSNPNPRVPSEEAVAALAARGVRASVVRLSPSVHGEGDKLPGFVPTLIHIAREKGVSAYLGEGLNQWTAVHRLDAVSLYRLALENAEAGVRYHGVAEEGIIFRDIAEAIGQQLNIPVVAISKEDAAAHFGWFAHFAAFNCPASNQLTRQQLNWEPVQPTLLADIAKGFYFK